MVDDFPFSLHYGKYLPSDFYNSGCLTENRIYEIRKKINMFTAIYLRSGLCLKNY